MRKYLKTILITTLITAIALSLNGNYVIASSSEYLEADITDEIVAEEEIGIEDIDTEPVYIDEPEVEMDEAFTEESIVTDEIVADEIVADEIPVDEELSVEIASIEEPIEECEEMEILSESSYEPETDSNGYAKPWIQYEGQKTIEKKGIVPADYATGITWGIYGSR